MNASLRIISVPQFVQVVFSSIEKLNYRIDASLLKSQELTVFFYRFILC